MANVEKNTSIDWKNGFNIIVNLYIIRMVYKVMGKTKANGFNGVDFYKDVLSISRPRFGRICSGDNFQITKEERKNLAALFNIEETYFQANEKIIGVHQIEEVDWKCLLKSYYGLGYDVTVPSKIMNDNADKVECTLKQAIKKKLIESTYDVDEPLYRIYYYFKHGTPYREESQLTKFTRELAKLKISDWDEVLEDAMQLKHYGEMLDKHNRYIQAVLTCIECRE